MQTKKMTMQNTFSSIFAIKMVNKEITCLDKINFIVKQASVANKTDSIMFVLSHKK